MSTQIFLPYYLCGNMQTCVTQFHSCYFYIVQTIIFKLFAAHSAHSDHARLESIKRQILTKLGLKQKPNVSHPLPKQFIWDTIYRADGIRSVVSDFDFSENGSHQWKLMSEVDNTKEAGRAHSAKANDITKLLLNIPDFQNGEFANTLGKKKNVQKFLSKNNYTIR